jgi:hypothetical protein
MLGLAVLAAIAGSRVDIKVRQDRQEPLNLYVAVGLAPGTRKSPVYERMIKGPVHLSTRQSRGAEGGHRGDPGHAAGR